MNVSIRVIGNTAPPVFIPDIETIYYHTIARVIRTDVLGPGIIVSLDHMPEVIHYFNKDNDVIVLCDVEPIDCEVIWRKQTTASKTE